MIISSNEFLSVLVGIVIGVVLGTSALAYLLFYFQKKNEELMLKQKAMIENLANALDKYNGGKKNA
jgi:hypothetical protein